MLFRTLIEDIPGYCEVRGNIDTEIKTLVTDSRKKVDSGLFFCIPGLRFDAHEFARQAVDNGCVALIVERFVSCDVAQVKVENARSAMAYVAGAFFGHPARSLKMIGMCGTKGKTTTSYLMKAILEKAGYKTGLIGTTGNMIGDRLLPSNMTTPDPVELHSILRRMADEGVQAVSMEVSAHAVDMHRLDGIEFEAACFTNLSQDHLDYFGNMETYFNAKKSFFTDGMVHNAAVNADDDHGARLLSEISIPKLSYAISANADMYARDIEITEEGVRFSMNLQGIDELQISMKLTGMFNVYNAMAAAGMAMIMGVSKEAIREGLESVRLVPGRVEILETRTPYKVILDYAHSPDALENVLNTIRGFTRGRLIVLVGCGGDRDRGKRPMMGEIAGTLADFSILTSDNPRTEDPMAILATIEEGIRPTGGKYTVIENRREAIRFALDMAAPGDVVVLAGKGNEDYQEIMGIKHPFDERIVVQELLDEKMGKGEN